MTNIVKQLLASTAAHARRRHAQCAAPAPGARTRSGRARLAVLLALLALAGCAAQQAYQEGVALVQTGNYEAGLAKLEDALRQDPGNVEYRKDLARARERAAGILIQKGNTARGAEQWSAAENAYGEALRVDPANGRARLGLEAVAMDRRHAALLEEAKTLLTIPADTGEGIQGQAKAIAATWMGRGVSWMEECRAAGEKIIKED